MTDDHLDVLVADLSTDGIVVTREEVRQAVRKVAELLLMLHEEGLPLAPKEEMEVSTISLLSQEQ